MICAPLVLGLITQPGLHASQDLLDQIQDQVRAILRELRNAYRCTPLILLTALAEAADRAAAEVAREPDDDPNASGTGTRAQLAVILPKGLVSYETKFGKEKEQKQQFEIGLREAHLAGHEPDVDGFIVRHCQILVAIRSWENRDSREDEVGRVVALQLEGTGKSRPESLDPPDRFPVFQLLVRKSDPPSVSCDKRYPRQEGETHRPFSADALDEHPGKVKDYFAQMFGDSETFNAYASGKKGTGLRAAAEKSRAGLIPEERSADLLPGHLDWLERYGFADALALRFQRYTRRGQIFLHGIVFVAFLLFVCFAHLSGTSPWWRIACLGASILVIFGAFLVYRRMIRGLDKKFQDYRALAEGLRVKFFWTVAGLKEEVVDHYFGKQRTELDWIRNGFRGWDILERTEVPESEQTLNQDERMEFVHAHWLEDQRRYFARVAKENHAAASRYEVCGIASLLLAVGFAALGALFLCRGQESCFVPVIIAADAFLAAAALMHHYRHAMAFAEHSERYSRMEPVYRRASEKISESEGSEFATAQHWLVTLGGQALTENGDWVLLHRERPLEFPHP